MQLATNEPKSSAPQVVFGIDICEMILECVCFAPGLPTSATMFNKTLAMLASFHFSCSGIGNVLFSEC